MTPYSQDFELVVSIEAEPPPGGAAASVSIRFATGATYRFEASTGTELEPWHDRHGRFTMRNILCEHPFLPAFRAYYRPDTDGGREEWVFELGDPWLKPVGVAMVKVQGAVSILTTKAPHGLRSGWFTRMDGLSFSGGNCRQQTVTVIDEVQISIPVANAVASANATVGPWDLPAYEATITRADGTEELPISVPEHYQYSRWRWQSDVRSVRHWTTGAECSAEAAYAELVDRNLVPPFDSTLAIHPLATVTDYAPMGLCGLPPDQSITGGRPDIGFVPAQHAEYLYRGADEASFRNHAEAANTYQWCIRDPNTGAPLSLDDLPGASVAWNSGAGWIPKTDRNRPEPGHMPSLAYVPYLLTGDPYHLESLQFYANMGYILGPNTPPTRVSYGAGHRYIAWPVRNWGQWCAASPESTPSWLLPLSYAEYRLDMARVALMTKAEEDDPYRWLHHAIPLDGYLGDTVWQHGFLSLIAAWLVAVGRSEWREFATWVIQGEVDRTSSTSGYQRSNPSPYALWMRNVGPLAVPLAAEDTALVFKIPVPTFAPGEQVTIDSPTETVTLTECIATDRTVWNISRITPKAHGAGVNVWGRKFASWPEVMDCNRIMAPERWVAPAEGYEICSDCNQEYNSFHHAAMAMARRAGLQVPELDANAEWLEREIRKQLNSKHIGSNWALGHEVMPPVREADKELLRRLLRLLLELLG